MIWMAVSTFITQTIGWRRAAIALAVLALAIGLYGFHVLDKRWAVKAAREGLVSRVELSAAKAELKVLKDRAAALEAANFQFQRQLQEAEALQTLQAQELEDYESTVDAVVDRALLERLRNR
ncbi:hypothetical protein [Roseibium alexandrii]|uniref:Uncharacterized protein n=1 Tax=Roseibium alexandrii (strain DSM 17067 / NCIMB 14079 / DFL-11) TaxID=244592 RepID=A0A5E8H294_ROSAD|nr:hypothetical protein [Roseibium alexandrii]EEE45995.1 hypothetical protein SADFL11_3284 [Roseibium alexandrii DFL-11]